MLTLTGCHFVQTQRFEKWLRQRLHLCFSIMNLMRFCFQINLVEEIMVTANAVLKNIVYKILQNRTTIFK